MSAVRGTISAYSQLLRVAHNNANRALRYIPRNVNVHPHQFATFLSTFDTLVRTNSYVFVYLTVYPLTSIV